MRRSSGARDEPMAPVAGAMQGEATTHDGPSSPTPYPSSLSVRDRALRLPVFLPDATRGVVRAVDAADLERAGVEALVMNTYHLMQRPGSSTIRALGGLHRMSGWAGPIVTDSGGFQAYSLVTSGPKLGRIADDGIEFRPEGARRPFRLTAEKSVQLQLAYGADVVICLDEPTHVDAPPEAQAEAVRRTVLWAERSRREFDRLLCERRGGGPPPLLWGVIQGGDSPELRRRCAEALLEFGFDGYGYGGWPLDGEGRLLADVLRLTRELVLPRFPMHALGVGHPAHVAACSRMGYGLFDSALPTRDARRGRLYDLDPGALPPPGAPLDGPWCRYVYVGDEKHTKATRPVSAGCDCPACARYSLGYLHHLWKLGDALYARLATIHNLRSLTRLTDRLRDEW